MFNKAMMIAVILLVAVPTLAGDAPGLGISADATFVSKYLWHGFDLFDDKAAFQPSVNVDFWDSGFSFNYWTSIPCTDGLVNFTEFDYTFAYGTTLFEGQRYAMDVGANFIYYDFPDEPSTAADAQEVGAGFAWPDLCPFGIVPSYYVGRIWTAKSNSTLGGEFGGWIHVFGLGYDMTIPQLGDQVFSLSADVTYNDGYGSATAKHDWSHATLGVSTGVDICENLTFTPGVYYQISMDDSVNNENELWTGLSLTYEF